MKRDSLRRAAAPLLMLALVFSLALPSSALFWNKKTETPYVADFAKNGLIGSTITFSPEDFVVKPDGGNIVLDIQGKEREGLTVKDLLLKFKAGAGKALDNDRILLS